MRIVSIHVQGFGVLRERTLDTPGPLALLYGANEAGKSTLMGFIRAVLFGFPSRANPAERYEPPAGGAHGGSLTLLDEQGRRILVERFDGSAGGKRRSSAGIVKVTLGDGTTGGEELLNALLSGLSADLYRSLFAFGLGELQELRTLQSEEISGYLYSAGLGVSGSVIMDAERKLTAQTDALYRPRGRNQEINKLQKELEELERALRRSKERTADYERWKEEKQASELRIEELEREKRQLRLELHKLEQAGKARASWIRLGQLESELSRLPVRETFPEHAVSRWESLEEESDRIQEERARLEWKLSSLKAKLDGIEPDEQEPEAAGRLEHLLELAPVYIENQRVVVEINAEIKQLEQQLGRLIGQIDERWDRAKLEACPVSISLREQIRSFREKLKESQGNIQRLAAEREGLKLQRSRLHDALRDQESELLRSKEMLSASASGSMNSELIDGGQDAIRSLQRISRDYAQYRMLSGELEHQRERIADHRMHRMLLEEAEERNRQEKIRNRKLMAGALATLGLVLLIWLLTRSDWMAAGVTTGILLGLLGYAFFFRTSSKKSGASVRGRSSALPETADDEEKLRHMEASCTQLQIKLISQVDDLMGSKEAAVAVADSSDDDRIPPSSRSRLRRSDSNSRQASARSSSPSSFQSPSPEIWSAVRQWLETELEQWQEDIEQVRLQLSERQRRQERVSDLKQSLDSLDRQEEQIELEEAGMIARQEDLRQQWSRWLESLGLNGRLTPDAALESLQLAEQGQELLRQLEKLEARSLLLQTQRSEYEQETASLLGPAAASDPVQALKRWKEQAVLQLRLMEEKKRGEQEWTEGFRELQLLEQRAVRCGERKRSLLEEAFAAGGEQLRHNESEQLLRMKLIEEKKLLQGALEAQAGAGLLPELTALLDSTGDEELSRSQSNLQQQISALEEQANLLREQNGRLAGEIEKLELGAEHSSRLQQLEEKRASLRNLVDRYATLSFASLLMKKARDVYEQERQPGVLLRASEYFNRLTNGRYASIKAPFGEQKLVAVKENGEAVDTVFLSRGTAEQLYLAMRFALIEEYARHISLPLILDDILVNFDQQRMETCLEILVDLGSRHQILLFTCHQHVRDAVVSRMPQFQLIQL